MTIKLILLQSGEQIVTDAREIISDEKTVAYLFKKPHKVSINKPFLVSEDNVEKNDSVQVTLGPWILLTTDEEIAVPTSYVVTIVDPIDSLESMYLEKTQEVSRLPKLSSDEVDKLRGMFSVDDIDLEKLSQIYSPEELQSLKELYLGKSNGTNDQVSSSEE